MPTRQELVAFDRSEDEVAEAIGADKVIFQVCICYRPLVVGVQIGSQNPEQNLDDLVTSVAKFNRSIKTFDVSVFNGCYVTGDVTPEYLLDLERSRSEAKRSELPPVPPEVIGLYNNTRLH